MSTNPPDSMAGKRGLVVFGSWRFGTSALCDMIHNHVTWLGIDSVNLSEYLGCNHYQRDVNGVSTHSVIRESIPFADGSVSLIRRPTPTYLVRSKLRHLDAHERRFFIIKMGAEDLLEGNDVPIYDHLINDGSVIKIGLNRRDVGAALISLAMGDYFNIWSYDRSELDRRLGESITPKEIRLGSLRSYSEQVLWHNDWLHSNLDLLDQLVWFDQLPTPTIEAIGMSGEARTYYAKNHMPHRERALRYFTNGEELLRYCDEFEEAMRPLIDRLG